MTTLIVAICFARPCHGQNLSLPFWCWSVLCLLAQITRIESSRVESTVAHSDATSFDSTIQCNTDTALLEIYTKQTVCCSNISISWWELNMSKGENIVKWIKGQRISWLGNLERMEEDRMPKKIFTQKLEGTKRRGRPRKGWREEVEREFQVLRVRKWREVVTDRTNWRDR